MYNQSPLIREFEKAASLEYKDIGSHLPADRIPIAFFCPYVPEEMLHAAGAFPFRLIGPPIKMSRVQAHLPPNCCHLAKSSLESLLQGELEFLKGIIFSHTCDVMQGLSDIFLFQKRIPLQFNLMMPTHLSSERSLPYLKEEIRRFKDFLDSNVGEVSSQNLASAIRLFNQIREKIQRLYQLRKKGPVLVLGDDFAHIIRAGYQMDRNRYLVLLNELLNELPRNDETKAFVPVYLIGNMIHSPSYFTMIEEAGASVVYDNLCSGARFLRLMTREDIDPMDAIAERYLSSFLCPAKHGGASAHLETLIQEVGESGAKGVIFLFYKYCEPHYFDYPDLKRALEARSIPSLLLEVDDPATSQGQLKIRIQAFIEMLSPI
jgi:benzoyl-CoA reductase/2-hydroxyglutaryl-CoA dehydratase subunit BcrC/BadD/HgdB